MTAAWNNAFARPPVCTGEHCRPPLWVSRRSSAHHPSGLRRFGRGITKKLRLLQSDILHLNAEGQYPGHLPALSQHGSGPRSNFVDQKAITTRVRVVSSFSRHRIRPEMMGCVVTTCFSRSPLPPSAALASERIFAYPVSSTLICHSVTVHVCTFQQTGNQFATEEVRQTACPRTPPPPAGKPNLKHISFWSTLSKFHPFLRTPAENTLQVPLLLTMDSVNGSVNHRRLEHDKGHVGSQHSPANPAERGHSQGPVTDIDFRVSITTSTRDKFRSG